MKKMLVVLLVMMSLPVIGQNGIRIAIHKDQNKEPSSVENHNLKRQYTIDAENKKLYMVDTDLGNGDTLTNSTYILEFIKPMKGLITLIVKSESGERNEINFGVESRYVVYNFENKDVIIQGDVFYQSVLEILK